MQTFSKSTKQLQQARQVYHNDELTITTRKHDKATVRQRLLDKETRFEIRKKN